MRLRRTLDLPPATPGRYQRSDGFLSDEIVGHESSAKGDIALLIPHDQLHPIHLYRGGLCSQERLVDKPVGSLPAFFPDSLIRVNGSATSLIQRLAATDSQSCF